MSEAVELTGATRERTLARIGDTTVADTSQADLIERFAAFRDPAVTRAAARAHIEAVTTLMLRRLDAHLPVPDLLVPIARAGVAMWSAADAHFGCPETAFAIARKTKGTTDVAIALSSGLTERHGRVLLLDTVSATGDTVVRVAETVAERLPHARVDVALCYASPTAMALIRGCGAIDRIALAILSEGVDRAGWLLPKINGDAGDKLYGRPT